ncbi:hypothetical protein EMN47_07090 [Prolixibacteraceae bacterium JC049]|nr:hypothetical protein [Prolixibacteraceae bacterium JC049]
MKKKLPIFALILIAVLSSCIVTSFYPFYLKKDIQKDKRFEGVWVDYEMVFKDNHISMGDSKKDDAKPEWTFKMKKDSTGYKVTVGNVKGLEEWTDYKVTPFKLGKHQMLDFMLDDVKSNYLLGAFHLMPVHSVAKYHFSGDTLVINWFNQEYMSKLFKESKVRIDHLKRDGNILLTAKTEDLQKFVLRYINDPKAFSKENDAVLKLIRKND